MPPVAGGVLEFFGQGQAVERIHAMKQANRFGGLVALEVANHVPEGWKVVEQGRLVFPLLYFALAEFVQTGFVSLPNLLDRHRLCDADDGDLFRLAADFAGSLGDPLPNCRQIARDHIERLVHGPNSSRIGQGAVAGA